MARDSVAAARRYDFTAAHSFHLKTFTLFLRVGNPIRSLASRRNIIFLLSTIAHAQTNAHLPPANMPKHRGSVDACFNDGSSLDRAFPLIDDDEASKPVAITAMQPMSIPRTDAKPVPVAREAVASKPITNKPTSTANNKRTATAAGLPDSYLQSGHDKSSMAQAKTAPPEKRLRRFRPCPPQIFHDVYARSQSQRFYVLKRERTGTAEIPEEIVEMTGSTGNIYTVNVCRNPSCNCPHAAEGNQCKHILYVGFLFPLVGLY